MSLEAIKQITDAEKSCAQRKAEAVQAARKTVSDAEAAGKALLESRRNEAEAKVKAMMASAEAEAAVKAAAVREETSHACDALKSDAEQHLDAAADSIVRRVVKVT